MTDPFALLPLAQKKGVRLLPDDITKDKEYLYWYDSGIGSLAGMLASETAAALIVHSAAKWLAEQGVVVYAAGSVWYMTDAAEDDPTHTELAATTYEQAVCLAFSRRAEAMKDVDTGGKA